MERPVINDSTTNELLESFISLSHAIRNMKHETQLENRASLALLGLIHSGTATRVSEIAQYLHLSPSTISRQVDQLAEEGLVERGASQTDGRASPLALTNRGRTALKEARKSIAAALAPRLADWTQEDINTYISFNNRLQTNLTRAARSKGKVS